MGRRAMSRTVGVLVQEHIAAGLVDGSKVVGPLKLFPESAQSPDPLQSMPSADIAETIRGLVEKVAGGEKLWAVGVGFPGIVRSGVIEKSPNLHQDKGFALPPVLAASLPEKATGDPVGVF